MRYASAAVIIALLLAACGGAPEQAAAPALPAPPGRSLILATTTSTQDSGLLDELLPQFTGETGWRVKTLAVGTGQALELGRRGEADVLLVHAPASELQLMATGTAGNRVLVMHNDFVLVGPPGDPARIAGLSPAGALRRIAETRQPFITRGDDSGTEKKELELWEQAGVAPGGPWYQSTGQGMGATLRVASEKGGYTLTDRGTNLAQRPTLELELLNQGDKSLLNVYHVIEMTTRAGPRVQPDGAKAFADWIVSPRVQQQIGEFGRAQYGEPLFTPDAGKPEDQLAA